VKVEITAPVQCVHAGKKFTQGDTTPDLPDHVGYAWIRQGWATESKPTKAAPRKRSS
jgi:hypothetical protein